ncbi:MAG TPA: hypothetical protein VKA89_00050 [Solirubrobacterales bacterium]|nr:hypothetical protein [Solirubrobacterales bacterium]
MTKRNKIMIVGASVLALGAGGASYAIATGDDENTPPIKGAALDHASAAALRSTGGGRVTETEVGDEESYYEVEVTKGDGSQVDVQLDRGFDVVGSSADHEESGEQGDD